MKINKSNFQQKEGFPKIYKILLKDNKKFIKEIYQKQLSLTMDLNKKIGHYLKEIKTELNQ